MKSEKKKRHIILKVFIVLIVLIVAACVGIYVWQKDNIDAAIVGMQYSQEEIAEKMADSKAVTEQSLQKYNLSVTRDFTVEEEEKIRKGEMTVEEAVANIMADSTSAGDSDASDSTTSSTSQTAEQTEEEKILSKYITEVYSLKAYYISLLGSVEQQIKSEYVASGRDKTKISSIVSNHLGEIASMESECDSQIDTLLSQLRSELNAVNADTSIVSVIEDAYISEKSLRKSYYLSQYK